MTEAMAELITMPNVSVAWSVSLPNGRELDRHADVSMEAGSTFKAIVAAACCLQVERGNLDWQAPLVIFSDDRVPASVATEGLPDGAMISLETAVQVMLTDSDNTATDLVIRAIGHDTVVRLARDISMRKFQIPSSLKNLYTYADDPAIAAFTVTMRDLRSFYDAVFGNKLFENAETQRRLLAVLRGEDEQQGSVWPHGVTCYRKSGSLQTAALFAQAIAGAFTKEDAVATWAFCVNQQPAPPPDMLQATSDAISRALGIALNRIAGALANIPPGGRVPTTQIA
jgi:beta-lactamase class A